MLSTTCISLKSVDSTNSWARHNLHSFNPARITVIWAEEQTKGRGRTTNIWISPPLENLYVSLVLPYEHSLYLLAQIASLATQKTLSDLNVKSRIKWPNDLVTDKGKISGILVEQVQETISWGIVGIGMNVQMKQPPKNLERPISSIYMETNKMMSPVSVLEKLIHAMQSLLKLPPNEIQSLWHKQIAWMVGTTIHVKINDEKVEAQVKEISPDGRLTCMTDSGIQNIFSAEIF